MNGKNMLFGLQYIGDDLVENAEFGRFSADTGKNGKPRRAIRRPLLAAALIGAALLLVGCAVAYVLNLEKIKISAGTEQRDYSLVDGVYVKEPHTVNTTTLTLAGLEGSNAYKACADFYAFQEEYTADGEKRAENGTLPEDYWETYSDVMNAKARELAEKYGLKPEGKLLEFRTNRNLCDALDVERFDRSNPDISVNINGGGCYDTGNFWLNMDFVFPEDEGYEVLRSSGTLAWNRKDCFSRDYLTITDSGDWIEKNYTTVSGSQVLILHSPSQETGLILCDRGEALMALVFNANIEYLSEEDYGVFSSELVHMTDRQLELVADAIDFSVQPRILTQADVDAQSAVPREATQNGYTLTLKGVETDGYVARILLSLAAPEGTAFPTNGNLIFAEDTLVDENGVEAMGAFSIESVDDGDGKSNTADLLLIRNRATEGGSAPFTAGTTWNLYLVDIVYSAWNAESGIIRDTLAEGEWLIPISFDDENGDYRELELVSDPITMEASVGWDTMGKDAVESFRVTSVKLRSQSISLTADVGEKTYADFFAFNGSGTYVVMKDGTQVEVMNQAFRQPIDPEQADYVLFADGTKLTVPGE